MAVEIVTTVNGIDHRAEEGEKVVIAEFSTTSQHGTIERL